MIDYKYSDLFQKDSAKKELVLSFGTFNITNEKLYAEAFELQESLCSQEQLRFGCCEASVLKFKCRNDFGELKNKYFEAFMVLDGNVDNPFNFGLYKVYSDEPSGDKKYKNVTAYDLMYDIINADVTTWYNGLSFPLTLKDFRNSFFGYLGISQEDIALIQDDMLVEKTIDSDSIDGKQVITAICEINGVFGHIKQGMFSYVSLQNKKQMIYPSENVYPSKQIYPSMLFDKEYTKIDIPKNLYKTCEYADFETQFISKLQIRQEENDIGAIVGTGQNTYIVEGNFLVYGKSASELSQIASKLFSKIVGIQYRPFRASAKGNPCIELGDIVNIQATYKNVESYLLERTLKGIQSLTDSFESKGVYEYEEKVSGTNKEIRRLKGKTNKLERTVEMLNSEINDEETGLKSQIKQAADEIEAKVSKGDVSSEISLELGKILLRGNRIAIESDYFTLTDEGKISATSGNFGVWNITPKGFFNDYLQMGMINYDNRFGMIYGGLNFNDVESSLMEAPLLIFHNGHIKTTSVEVVESLTVEGAKSRLSKTKSYNDRLLYCYEMPSPMFGDIGHGVIGADGLCYIDLDQIFFETIDTIQSYQVFLQSYAESNVYVIEKQQHYFVVKGLPNTEFDWEIKAKQYDMPMERLEEYSNNKEERETNYVALAVDYLFDYEQEVLNYE